MKIGMIGLGKMGHNIALNLKDHGWDVVGFDVSSTQRQLAEQAGLTVVGDLEKLADELSQDGDKRVAMLSTPAGAITNGLVVQLVDLLKQGDVIIDGGNSNYKDSLESYQLAATHGIDFLDCGTSGGTEGARYGACLMVGGDPEVFAANEKIFSDIACDKGYIYSGKPGSGHYLKMVHNGIEYGMMQAIGEGFDVLKASQYDFDFEEVSRVWNHGSVIRSWLIELIEEAFKKDAQLDHVRGKIHASGEAKWTIEEALKLQVPVPVIANSLFVRNASNEEDSFSAKVVAMLRNGFGGHDIESK